MPITAADLLWKRSINTGPGNSTAQADPDDSIGGFMSTTELTSGASHDIFDPISGAENQAGTIDYRCVFIHNNHGTLTLQAPRIWITNPVAGGADAAIALDDTGVVAEDSASAQAERIADENTAPSGETFSAPTSKATGLAPGDIGPGQCVAVWIRRTATDSAALNDDGFQLNIEGDTAA